MSSRDPELGCGLMILFALAGAVVAFIGFILLIAIN